MTIDRLLQQLRDWSTLTLRRRSGSVPLAVVIAGAREGDPRCIGELYRRYRAPVLRMLTALAPGSSEDVTQEVFLTLPAKLARYQERGSFESWLKRVAINVQRTRSRSSARRREQDLPAWLPAADPDEPGPATWTDLWERAMADMPETLREAWELHRDGYEAREIAAILDLSPGAAATRLTRAREYLRQRLKDLL